MRRHLLGVWLIALFVSACGIPGDIAGAADSETQTTDSWSLPEGVADQVVEDARARLPANFSEVDIIIVAPILFEDSSMDCPEAGVTYDSVDMDGFEVVVETGAGHLVYKVDDGGEFMLCLADSSEVVIEAIAASTADSVNTVPTVTPTKPDPLIGSNRIELIQPQSPPANSTGAAAQATADLAQRLGIAEESITLVLSALVTWGDGSLGCPEPDRSYTQSLVEGFRVILEANGVSYAYHGAVGGALFLCTSPSANGVAGS